MDPVTNAVAATLAARPVVGLSETDKTAIADAYQALKALLYMKFRQDSELAQALSRLETKPDSPTRLQGVMEEITALHAEQDTEVLHAAKQLSTLVHTYQPRMSTIAVQNNAPVHGQQNGDHNTLTQHFGSSSSSTPEV